MPKDLNIALIGSGAVAPHHINAWKQVNDAHVSIVMSEPEEKCREFASKFELECMQDFDAILNNPEIDILDIVVPSGAHAELGIAGAKAGKHILVEKPIDVTLEKADALINACQQADVTLGVVSQYRFMEPTQKLYKYVREGKLGDLIEGDAYIKWFRSPEYYASGDWRGTYELDGGGPFINQGIHFIDMLLSVMGPVKNVYAKTRNVAHPEIEVEDIGIAMVEFVRGAFGIIQASTAIYPGLPARLEIHGTKGTICVEGEKLAFLDVQGEKPFKAGKVEAAGAADPMSIDVAPFVREFEDFVSAIRERREPVVNGAEARRSLQLILAIYESSNTGKKIKLN